MKKRYYVLPLLLLVLAIPFSACGEGEQVEGSQGDLANYTFIQDINISGIRYNTESLDLFSYKGRISHNIGSVILYNDLVFIPRVAEGLRWSAEILGDSSNPYTHLLNEAGSVARFTELLGPSGEFFVVGQDVIYGEDFFSFPVFDLWAVDYANGSDDRITFSYFDPDVTNVRILALDIVSLSEPGGILLLIDLFKENGDSSVVYLQITRGTIDEPLRKEIDHDLLGGLDAVVVDAWFDASGNIFLLIVDIKTQAYELVILDSTATQRLARLDASFDIRLARSLDGSIWGAESIATPTGTYTILRSLNEATWTWTDEVRLSVDHAIGLYAAPEGSEFTWFLSTEFGLYGVTKEDDVSRYINWHDTDVRISHNTELLFPRDGEIIVLNYDLHPHHESAVMLDSTLLRRTDAVDEREILTVGGVNLYDPVLHDLIRRFNRESRTHRAVLVDYAEEGEWEGVAMRLRTDLITGRGPDVIVFNQWGDENDITSALMRGGFLADLNVFLESDAYLSREDFFENILDVWTNEEGELTLLTGAVIPTPYWGPSEKLDSFTDFTHEGFLEFLRNAKAQGIEYPMGLNFLPHVVLQTMLFADDTFFCFETGEANFDSDLFLDILYFADSIPDDQQTRWIEAMQTGEAMNPIAFMSRGEQLMTSMFGFIDVNNFRFFDAAVGGLTPIGAPNTAGELAIATRPITRMGIRANSQNAEAGWEFVRLYLLHPNSDGSIEGLPIKRSLFEAEINQALLDGAQHSADEFFGFGDGIEIPAFTEERASVLRLIMESITHEYHPDPHIMGIVWEEAERFFAGNRTAEDAARIIQSRVSIYVAERS